MDLKKQPLVASLHLSLALALVAAAYAATPPQERTARLSHTIEDVQNFYPAEVALTTDLESFGFHPILVEEIRESARRIAAQRSKVRDDDAGPLEEDADERRNRRSRSERDGSRSITEMELPCDFSASPIVETYPPTSLEEVADQAFIVIRARIEAIRQGMLGQDPRTLVQVAILESNKWPLESPPPPRLVLSLPIAQVETEAGVWCAESEQPWPELTEGNDLVIATGEYIGRGVLEIILPHFLFLEDSNGLATSRSGLVANETSLQQLGELLGSERSQP